MALGAGWQHVQLSPRLCTVNVIAALYGFYASSAGLLLAAVFGTQRSTPLAGAGHAGTEWQEILVNAMLTSGGVGVLVCCVLVLWGLRSPRPAHRP